MSPKTKTVLLILLSFGLGIFAGGFYCYSVYGSRGPQTHRSQADFRKAFAERVQLDAHQNGQVDSLVEIYRERMNVHRQTILSIRDTLRVEIRKLLSPAQNKLYDDYIREMDEREGRTRQPENQKK